MKKAPHWTPPPIIQELLCFRERCTIPLFNHVGSQCQRRVQQPQEQKGVGGVGCLVGWRDERAAPKKSYLGILDLNDGVLCSGQGKFQAKGKNYNNFSYRWLDIDKSTARIESTESNPRSPKQSTVCPILPDLSTHFFLRLENDPCLAILAFLALSKPPFFFL